MALGYTNLKFKIGTHEFNQKFLVMRNQCRGIILGRDFTIYNYIGISWTRQGTKRLTTENELIIELKETREGQALALKRSVTIPPRNIAVVQIEVEGGIPLFMETIPNDLVMEEHPNLWCVPHSTKK